MGNVLITGAASGIARAAAKRLAGRMTVYAADIDDAGLGETVDEIAASGGDAKAIPVDVSDRGSVETMVAAVDGDIDAAFFAAGIHIRGTAETVSEEDWDRMIGVHVKGTFLCCQATLRRMRAQGTGGAIVTMSSDYAVMAVPGGAAYCAAKAAIHSLTKSIAQEFAPDGIRINALGPGPIDTPILKSGRTEEEYEQARKRLADNLPIGRLGRPEEVAAVVDFLLSERSSYITGQIVHPNGGQLTW
ncbi:MAG: SDR family NAD(P)-dependent oxidoreductase [Defluviicoccus sp.]|nr:SDR family NAD(P)-dependent oxidoreductase [Defluviicoccus sp.]MDE0278649.1 SDR family NAD(P)-dependent oxidoreductase [Defluviicoccus sp.]